MGCGWLVGVLVVVVVWWWWCGGLRVLWHFIIIDVTRIPAIPVDMIEDVPLYFPLYFNPRSFRSLAFGKSGEH